VHEKEVVEDQIGYGRLLHDAALGVVRCVLARVAESGLPGEHHFYITVKPAYPGVVVSDELRARFPDELTIVLQHRFWDLEVGDDVFWVTLQFGAEKERLRLPFASIARFVDPSVELALQFPVQIEAAGAAPSEPTASSEPTPETPEAAEIPEVPGDPSVVNLIDFKKKRT
jgi:hypothetical protein